MNEQMQGIREMIVTDENQSTRRKTLAHKSHKSWPGIETELLD